MTFLPSWLVLLVASLAVSAKPDPCALIAGKKWVSPLEARTCLLAAPVDAKTKANLLEVVNKTLAFHTSTNYQIQAPKPFENDVHEDMQADLARIATSQYASDFELNTDLFYAIRRANDGHCGVYNMCYVSLYISYIPTPLVLVTEADGRQNVYIAPEAFEVSKAEFGDGIEFWQAALPGPLRGKLETLSGAKVLLIDGQDPFVAVDANAATTGGYQSLGTRQNSFFSSYQSGPSGWVYSLGNFALQTFPLVDAVELTIQRVNSSIEEVVRLPYRSRLGSGAKNFTDFESFRKNNCVAGNHTNGVDIYDQALNFDDLDATESPLARVQQHAPVDAKEARGRPMNVMLDALPMTDIELPEVLVPPAPLNESYSVAQFYMLKDNITGVLALGSFSAKNYTLFQISLLEGLLRLKASGAQQLVVDVTNNGGGYICIAHWLHRIIVGPKRSTEPQAGLDSATRAGPLARAIVKAIHEGGDPDELLSYNPIQWRNASNQAFEHTEDWMAQKKLDIRHVNGHEDVFSQRLGQECQPFGQTPPDEALFEATKVVIVSNGRCASSCSLFSITMSKREGVRSVVVGGRADTAQQYCGVVGGQSTNFNMIDTEVKSAKLKNHTLAPPDFLSNVVQGITWRLGFGIDDPTEPEEWQDHPASDTLGLTLNIVNRPMAIWEAVVKKVFTPKVPTLVVQGVAPY